MNNPFYYTPSQECLKAVKEVTDWLYGNPSLFCDHPVDPSFRAEIDKGKMFGVLIVERDQDSSINQDCNHKPQTSNLNSQTENLNPQTEKNYLAAYSGQVCGRSDWQEFVPAVFDYLQPNGYFKQHEDEISDINHNIANLQGRRLSLSAAESTADDPRPTINKSHIESETDEEYIHRRQFENAELHRWKLRQREREAANKKQQEEITSLKTLRRKKSDDLQRWLFSHFQMRNGKGETQDLLQITSWYRSSTSLGGGKGVASAAIPPAGSGECCEPKLLQYAFTHGLKPVSMAMFWWGESPKGEIRHHLHFYPACNSKCKPILKWMLQGINVDANPLEDKEHDEKLASQIKYLYEDDSICVIVKPAGLLSVQGKTDRESVQSIMRRRYPDTDSPLIVHRLDMATSGIMVIAKTMDAYHNLQRQFANHEIKKRYVAILEHSVSTINTEGSISLPLRPDIDDRPRQMVDFENGKEAVTYYKFVSDHKVYLWPQTGRTHQLRVHCAHQLGLNNPIKGDELYGSRADRLYLHAAEITFHHPATGIIMHFTDELW